MKRAGLILLSILTLAACKRTDGGDQAVEEAKAPVAGAALPAEAAPAETPEAATSGTSGRHRENPAWIPAEFKVGSSKWRDAGVYVDGKPVGILWFGDLPLGLKPEWVSHEVEDGEFRAGEKPKTIVERQRRYNFADYLKAVGVDLRKIKVVHVYGGRQFVSVIHGKDLRRKPKAFQFKFGRETAGKALAIFNSGIKWTTTFDHVTGVAVYVDKKPPTVEYDEVTELDGEPVDNVIPYFGAPLRGGIRVYKDDRLAAVIKRRRLAELENIKTAEKDGEVSYDLVGFLKAEGVETDDIVEADIILSERRVARVDRDQIIGNHFTASPQARGAVLLGGEQPMQALALYSKKAGPIPEVTDGPQ